jgi:protein O-GlcNAc transferase
MTALVTAVVHQQAGRLHEAEAIYKRILRVEPENVDAWYLLGVLARQAQEPDLAIRWIRRAIALNDRVAQFHNHLGAALLDTGDMEGAKRSFVRALQLQPRYVDAMLSLANLLIRTGKDEEAITCYRAALRLEPGDVHAASSLRLALRCRGRDEAV